MKNSPKHLMRAKVYQGGKEVADKRSLRLLRDEAAGVFESMRAYHGRVFLEEEHLQRLFESAKTVGYGPLPAMKELQNEIALALRASGARDASVRLTLAQGECFVLISQRECPAELYKKGVVLKTASFPRGPANAFPYQAKAAAYQHAVLASTEPAPRGPFDWIFIDRDGCLSETRVGNFFLVRYPRERRELLLRITPRVVSGATLLTPPEHVILGGVTRRFVIKCARESGIPVRETPLTRHDFFNADEAFLSNTSWEVLPVRELDGRAIGTKVPGPVTTKLHRLFKRRVQESCPNK